MEQVIKELPKVIMMIITIDMDVDVEEWEVLETLEWCVAKAKVLNCMSNLMDLEKAIGIMPSILRSVYSHMVHHLDVIDVSLKEVRSLSHYRMHSARDPMLGNCRGMVYLPWVSDQDTVQYRYRYGMLAPVPSPIPSAGYCPMW